MFTLLAGGAFVSSQIAITEMLRNEMLENGKGTLLFSGASSSLRGSKNFATFSPAKFALRSLSQSLAREFHPQGIHVGHVVIDGVIEQEKTREWIKEGTGLKPESLANVYFDLYKQDRSSWTQEIDTRPFCENF